MKIMITGGHVTPAIAVIDELIKREKTKGDNYNILFVGRKFALEGDDTISEEFKLINQKNIPFTNLTTGRLQRSFSKFTIISLLKIPVGLINSFFLLNSKKPDVILSFGGYLSFPVCITAWILKIPIIIHEQATIPGMANKLISKIASKICVSWEDSKKYFPSKKVAVTGLPIRKSVFTAISNFEIPENNNVIYITGGSLGSHSINKVIAEMIPKLLDKYIVIHQCGNSKNGEDFKILNRIRSNLPEEKINRYILETYIGEDKIGSVMNVAKIIIGRGGANTIAEIAALGKVSIIIPLPWAGSQEQTKNGEMLKKIGVSEMIYQKDLTKENLFETIDKIIENYPCYQKNIDNEKKLFIPDAAERIVDIIDEIRQKRIH